jgi:hypothetical protein
LKQYPLPIDNQHIAIRIQIVLAGYVIAHQQSVEDQLDSRYAAKGFYPMVVLMVEVIGYRQKVFCIGQ